MPSLTSKQNIDELFNRMQDLHVLVVGDVMLDNYWWGDVDRISPEAPVPIVTLRKRESRLGGAANVALNCRALGAKVSLASIIGRDNEGGVLIDLLTQAGIDPALILQSNFRCTTTKTRVISRNQQMLRLDDEVSDELSTEDEHPFIDIVLRMLQREKPDVLIFEDYNKGVLKENVIKRITEHCRELNIITAVDPKKKNFLAYKHVTIFKPNLKELREGLHLPIAEVNESELNEAHEKLKEILHHDISFVTLSEKGVYYNNGSSRIIPSHFRNIADVSGAGDTVIATAAMVYALSQDPHLMADISNIAGGLVCEEVGVVAINKQNLKDEVQKLIVR